MRLDIIGLYFLGLIFLINIQLVSAVPPLPAEYYGTIQINGIVAPAGTTITAYIDNVEKGTITTTEPGLFGGSGLFDPRIKVNISEDEYQKGPVSVKFLSNGIETGSIISFEPGTTSELNLSVYTQSSNTQSIVTQSPTFSPTPVPTFIQPGNNNQQEGQNNPQYYQPYQPTPVPTQIQGINQEMKYRSDDGMAELTLKKGTLSLSPSGQIIQNIMIKSRGIDDLALIQDKSLLFSGYAYEIIPERTYFNPEGMFKIYVPLDRSKDLFQMNPYIYQYDSKAATWNRLESGKNQYTGAVSADINEAAIYAIFLKKNNQGSMVTTMGPYQTNNNIQNSVYNNPQIQSNANTLYQNSNSVNTNTTYNSSQNVITTQKTSDNYTLSQLSDNISITPAITDVTPSPTIVSKSTPEKYQTSNNISTNSGQSTTPGILTGTGAIIIIIVLIIAVANIMVYFVYTRWWLKRR